MRALRYLPSYLVPALVAVSLFAPGAWSFLAVVALFGFFPLLELTLRGTDENMDAQAEQAALETRLYSWLVWSMVPIQYALLGTYLYRAASGAYTGVEWVGATWAMGLACGVLGINVAHDLGHRRATHEQHMAKALLLTSLYMHFFIEHNRGHHARVATEEDPASARFGESLFAFLPRSIVGSFVDAWQLEARRLERRGERAWSWKNQMLRFQVIQGAALVAVGVVGGPVALGSFALVALLGALLLETVNYVEHYGLSRARKDDGRFEKVRPAHSWNSNHPIGRLVLFELTRHSDHHANARRPYQVLRHFDESPQLPTGYPGMMVLAWFPPLWFAVMHRRLDAMNATPASTAVPAAA